MAFAFDPVRQLNGPQADVLDLNARGGFAVRLKNTEAPALESSDGEFLIANRFLSVEAAQHSRAEAQDRM